MNKKEFIQYIAEKHDLSLNQTNQIVETLFNTIKMALMKGETLLIPGFGGFKVVPRGERQGRNPKTGETLKIPACLVAQFKPATALKKELNEK